jgi:hypothetical protein
MYIYYVKKFISDLRNVSVLFFFSDTLVSSSKRTDRNDIAQILLKVVLTTYITLQCKSKEISSIFISYRKKTGNILFLLDFYLYCNSVHCLICMSKNSYLIKLYVT